MVDNIKYLLTKSRSTQFAICLFLILSAWWLILQFVPLEEGSQAKQTWAALYQLVALWGGIWGLHISRFWGGFKSALGRTILAFSLGLFAQSFGQSVYSFYIFYQKIEVPYPSIGDIGYFGSVLFYVYGALSLSKVAGAKISLRSFGSKVQSIIIPVLLLAASYLFFLRGYEFDWTNPLKIFLDFAYPLGQAFYVSLAILVYLLSRKLLGGIMRGPIIALIIALLFQYFADYTFLYQANQGAWFAGGINDYIYLVSYLMMTLALAQIGVTFKRIEES